MLTKEVNHGEIKKGLKITASPFIYVGLVITDALTSAFSCVEDLVSPVLGGDDAHLRDAPKDFVNDFWEYSDGWRENQNVCF